jgi:hypothetical protein
MTNDEWSGLQEAYPNPFACVLFVIRFGLLCRVGEFHAGRFPHPFRHRIVSLRFFEVLESLLRVKISSKA